MSSTIEPQALGEDWQRRLADIMDMMRETSRQTDPQAMVAAYGRRVAGVLLTGGLSDGVAGLITIKGAGGISVVQDPEEAEYPSMPRNALRYDHVDLVAGLAALPGVLTGLVAGYSLDQVIATGEPGTRRAWTPDDDEQAPPEESSG